MKAEIIAIGTEVLMGDVINSNAAWISKKLAGLGIDVFYHVTVGDNPTRINKVVQQAIVRSNILIFTGGLGPTDDDLTIDTLAKFFDTPLVNDAESEKAIREMFIVRGMPMATSNLKQALKPRSADVLKNPIGTAPGISWDITDKIGHPLLILTFPGVPRELYAMWDAAEALLIEKLYEYSETPMVLESESLHFFGIGESMLAQSLKDLMEAENPTVAPYVGNADVRIRISAKAANRQEAHQLIAPVKAEIIARNKEYYYAENGASLEAVVGGLLADQGKTVALAESCTGGLVSSRLTDIPGSSQYVSLNTVTYSNEQKTAVLGVKPETLQQHGAVSAETAAEMALGIQKLSGCDIGLSLTGIAGPEGGTADKPVGLVYVGLAAKGQEPITEKVVVNSRYSRTDIKFWFSQYGLFQLFKHLKA